jgi:predicted O-methyltransferase YrrM
MNTGLFFFRVIRYLKYCSVAMSRRGHGIHSPFLFDLVTRVFRNSAGRNADCRISRIRRNLTKDCRILRLTDLGAGGTKQVVRTARVSDVVRRTSVSPKYGRFLANMAAEFGKDLIIELGTAAGISTMYLANGSPGSRVITIEGSDDLAGLASANFTEAGLANITVLNGSFDTNLDAVTASGVVPGLIFIDGDHRRLPLLRYFDRLMQLTDAATVIIIDDINYSPEMGAAWKEIMKDERVAFTVDIYRMGIVFLRKGLTPGHYVVSY